MDMEQLQCFLAIIDSGSFSEAAERLFMTQSSVSKHIQALEKELKVTLFDRSRRKCRLTEAGELLLPDVRAMADLHRRLMETAADCAEHGGEELRIASIPVMAQYNITGLIADFSCGHPSVHLHIREVEGADIAARLKAREFDFGFMRTEQLDDRFAWIPVAEDRMAVAVGMEHPFSRRRELSLQDLKEEKFLLLGRSTLLYEVGLKACREEGFVPDVIYTGERMDTILGLVGRNQGITLMMGRAASYSGSSDVRIIPLKEEIKSTVGLVRLRRKTMSGPGKAFWESVRESVSREC